VNYNLKHRVAQNVVFPFFSFRLMLQTVVYYNVLNFQKKMIICVKVTHVRTMGISGLMHMGAKVY
jgi:hypothetical protein